MEMLGVMGEGLRDDLWPHSGEDQDEAQAGVATEYIHLDNPLSWTLAKCKHLIDVWVRIASWLTRWALWKMEDP